MSERIELQDYKYYQSASYMSLRINSTSATLSFLNNGLAHDAKPTSMSPALKSLLTQAYNTFIAVSTASFSFH